jgi:hypothetical protein
MGKRSGEYMVVQTQAHAQLARQPDALEQPSLSLGLLQGAGCASR